MDGFIFSEYLGKYIFRQIDILVIFKDTISHKVKIFEMEITLNHMCVYYYISQF